MSSSWRSAVRRRRRGAARADLAGHDNERQLWTDKAAALTHAFNEKFWLPDHGWYALGLDADKRPIDALTSNIGHCLWTGIIDDDKAASVAKHLMSPSVFSGWASAPSPSPWPRTTRSATTTAPSGRTTTHCAQPA